MIDSVIAGLSHEQEGCNLSVRDNVHLQLDADGACYHVAKAASDINTNFKGLVSYIHSLRASVGAVQVNVHTTLALKGGREQMAWYVPYQEKRRGHSEPEYVARVRDLRDMLYEYTEAAVLPFPQYFVEADDSMTQMHLARIKETGDPYASVIGTDDKDLNMVAGNILNLGTKKTTWNGTFSEGEWVDNLGWCKRAAPTGSKNKKLLGRGYKFFWAQMLAGDTADNIKGVPSISGYLADVYTPLKGNRQRAEGITVACGDAFAATLISQQPTEFACYNVVKECYKSFFGDFWDFYLFENAFLLWMRRTPNILDCLDYLGQFGFNYTLHAQQVQAIQEYKQACVETMANKRKEKVS